MKRYFLNFRLTRNIQTEILFVILGYGDVRDRVLREETFSFLVIRRNSRKVNFNPNIIELISCDVIDHNISDQQFKNSVFIDKQKVNQTVMQN